ncbi:MAG TPA: glycoside hydrolase family 15 protein, partial [Chloroflexota bacterium]|nr:glycoside hydrolase family 15 protein [Chloroflexota bacterium]
MTAPAVDGPGAVSHFDLARKDCLGTARNTRSKVWFTVANGVLSDVYYPTIDNTNVETLQYIVTDGQTFTDLQTRDMTYSAQVLDRRGRALDCRVTTTAKNRKYRIVTDYLTDPGQNTVVMRTRFQPLVGHAENYRLYVRYDPTINGNGGGGSGNGGADSGTVDLSTGHSISIALDTVTATNAANRDYAEPVFSALDASRPFLEVSNGFVGAPSDGLLQLDAAHALTSLHSDARLGNLVQTARVDLSDDEQFTLVLGFGATQTAAEQAAATSLKTDFDDLQERYEDGWRQYDDALTAPPHSLAGVQRSRWDDLVNAYYLSVNVVKASEDKTFPGAIAASLASPWGQAVSAGDPANTYFGSYREVFARDAYEAWTGLLVAGDVKTARDVATYLLTRQQQADGSMPRNSLINGKPAPDTFNVQMDETSYPLLMANQLHMTDATLYEQRIKPGANFVISHGPSFGPERWEEQGGYSPSTISAEIAGLIAAADLADANHDPLSARIWRGVADDWQRTIKSWTVTTNGPLSADPYFIRLSKTGDPNAAISYNVGNGGPTLDQRAVIDAGFLELVRLGLLPASDSDVLRSLKVVDATIKAEMPTGPGWLRYNGDGYGDGAGDGHPWAPSGKGTGHPWPVLSNERGEFAVLRDDRTTALNLLTSMRAQASGIGLIPEQVWNLADLPPSPFGTDPTLASIGFANGHSAGSAAPLTWAAGVYPRLLRDIVEKRLVEQPSNTLQRYVQHTQFATTLTVTAPADQSAVSSSPVTVSGVSAAGNTVSVAATNEDNNSQTTTASGTAAADGHFSVAVPITGGTNVLNVVAVSPSGATAHATRTVVWDFVPGTVLLDVADPDNDDHGPGNYAYPTAGDFHPGAFDMQRFQVLDDAAHGLITFRVQVRDLSPTFGSPLG